MLCSLDRIVQSVQFHFIAATKVNNTGTLSPIRVVRGDRVGAERVAAKVQHYNRVFANIFYFIVSSYIKFISVVCK